MNKAVVTTATWKDNDVIKALGELPNQLISELPNIQVFGAVGDKNFTRMGDVTGSGVVVNKTKTSFCRMPISIAYDWWRQTAIRQWLFLQSVLGFMVIPVRQRLKSQ